MKWKLTDKKPNSIYVPNFDVGDCSQIRSQGPWRKYKKHLLRKTKNVTVVAVRALVVPSCTFYFLDILFISCVHNKET